MRVPTISVVMSAYNGQRYLASAIESVLGQTFSDFEFLILDDGSTDGSAAIIDGYAQKDARIRFISRENKGLITSLNELIALSRARLIARMDADDLCLPERLSRQFDFLSQNTEYGVIGTWTHGIDPNGAPFDSGAAKEHACTHEDFLIAIDNGWPLLCHPTVMMRRDVVTAVGGYHRAFRYCEDYDLWLRLASITRLASIPERLLQYRFNDDQVSRRHAVEQRIGAAISYLAYQERLAGRPDPTEGLDRLPAIDDLDDLFQRKGVSATVRAQVAPSLLYSRWALHDEGLDLIDQHVRSGGDRSGMWRTVVRLLKWGQPRQALRLATTLVRK